jgi:mannan endo-1,4-beta-mannosidase
MEHYPGDDIIDLLGLDLYCNVPDGDTLQVAAFAEALDKQLVMISQIAKERGKTMALTETGYEGIKTKDWWTKTLAPVLARHPICYVLVGRNAHNTPTHYYAPYPGESSTSDFVKFYNLQETLFLHDVNGLYLKKEKH